MRVFDLDGLDESTRSQMHDGYTVGFNRYFEPTIIESDFSNNSINILPGSRLWVNWESIGAPKDYRNRVEYRFDAYILSGDERRLIADWNIRQPLDWDTCSFDYCSYGSDTRLFDISWFDIYSDERMEIVITVAQPGTLYNPIVRSKIFSAVDNWGSQPIRTDSFCRSHRLLFGTWSQFVPFGPQMLWLEWGSRFNICAR